jgi:hypothetical protein
MDTASYEPNAYLFHVPLLLDSLQIVVKTLFAYQYPVMFCSDSSSQLYQARFDGIAHLIDGVFDVPRAFLRLEKKRRLQALRIFANEMFSYMMKAMLHCSCTVSPVLVLSEPQILLAMLTLNVLAKARG